MNIKQLGGAFASLTSIGEQELLDRLEEIVQSAGEDNPEAAQAKALSFLDEQIAARMKEISKQQYSRGLKEGVSGIEKQIREHFDYDGDAKGFELVKEVVSTIKPEPVKEKAKTSNIESLSQEQLKQLPNVQELLKPYMESAQTAQNELEHFKTQVQEEQHANKVRSAIREQFRALNPVLPSDEQKARRAEDAFVNSFDPKRFAITDKGVLPLNDTGNPLTDDKFHEVDLTKFVESSNWYDVHKQDPQKSSASVPTNSLQQPATASGTLTPEELTQKLSDPSIPIADKQKLLQANS